jgi:hypothetical protein
MRSGHHQIHVKLEYIVKNTFIMQEGHYEFKVMVSELANALVTFQAIMNKLFQPYLRKSMLVFFFYGNLYTTKYRENIPST